MGAFQRFTVCRESAPIALSKGQGFESSQVHQLNETPPRAGGVFCCLMGLALRERKIEDSRAPDGGVIHLNQECQIVKYSSNLAGICTSDEYAG